MKKWYLFFLTIVLIACYDDEGSYSYKELNDVTIGGIIDNDWYNKFTYVDTLRINPKLTLALGGTDSLTYGSSRRRGRRQNAKR